MTTDLNGSKTRTDDLVVVGSSAGGISALSTLVSTLSKSFPAPVVLAQHLDPQRQSNLGSILERRSTLPVVVVSERNPTLLESGKIYVVPANRHVRIVEGHVNLEEGPADGPKPSVDKLLSSAARAYGEHLIAVILTGSGSDGASGAVDVKNSGGIVIIQNPQTALYPSMPLSLPPTAVDHVVEIEQIGPLLSALLRSVNLPQAFMDAATPAEEKAEDPLRELLTHVSAQTNIDFRDYKASTIVRRIGRRMAVTHNNDVREYTDYLRTHPEEVSELVKAFLIRVTGFFRDPEAFDLLKETVIPELIDRSRENGRTLRIWSAGCATGEEAYSLALLVADHLGPEFPEWNVKVFATDLSSEAITFARRGLYPENVLEDLPDDYRNRFFERVSQGYRVTKIVRQAVIFGQQDISRGVPFPRIHLVTCRNLLIYLKPELQQIVLDLFAYSLQESHGYLFLGKAETARPTKANFELVNKKWKIYRCRGRPQAVAVNESFLLSHPSEVWRELHRRRPTQVVPYSADLTQPETDIANLRRINETMLRYTNVAIVVIDNAYRILTMNPAAKRLLGIRDNAYDQDFLHTVRGMPYLEMRGAIDTVFHEHTTVNLSEVELDPASEGSGRHLGFTIMLMKVEQGAPELAVITATDVTEPVQMRKRLEAIQREHAELVTELSTANRRLSTMNKEFQDANEELQAANEELMLTQEELQATNEEFETTNEELQATNEELETNNEELQATNEELQATNDELTARTIELQELTKQHRVEQLQLSTMLERFPHYVMILNADDLTVQALNPAYKQMLADRDAVGLPLTEILEGPDVDKLIKVLKRAVREGQSLTTGPIQTGISVDGKVSGSFVHTAVPITDEGGLNVIRLFIYSESADSG